MVRILHWVLAVLVIMAVASCRDGGAGSCGPGQTSQGGTCVPGCAGTICGGVCCAAGDACLAPGLCSGGTGSVTPCGANGTCDGGLACIAGQCVSANGACSYRPPKGAFTPRIAWQWTGSAARPEYANVLMTPVVVPLQRTSADVFAPPAVVFNAILGDRGAGSTVPGVVVAVSGLDGSELWTSDPSHPVNGLGAIAAADLLGDGHTEIVTARLGSTWPATDPLHKGPPLDDGLAAFDADGRFLGPVSTVADVDLDGVPDIVTGNTVYDNHCNPKAGWPNGQADGLVAVADFTGDQHPEIVVVSEGTVRLQDWQEQIIWGPVA